MEFNVVLIDVAPRMTTGTVDALCASTHVLVPTIFNPLSAEPVQNFVRMAKGLMDTLNPKLEFLGIGVLQRHTERRATQHEMKRVVQLRER
jgi:chromosome partitioning protein